MNDPIELPTYYDEDLAELSPFELTDLLIEDEDRVPRNVIDECARHNEAMVAHLRMLHEDGYLWLPDASRGEWWLRLHAAMILGLIPAESAGLLLAELMRRMSLEDEVDLQDWLSGYWSALFRNKPESVQPALRQLCEDGKLGRYMRTNAFEAVIETASRQGGETLEQSLAWLAKIAANENEDWECRLGAANILLDFPRAQYRPLLENLEARQTGWGKHFDRQEIEQAYAGQPDAPQWERFANPWKFYEPEAITERQQRWREEDARDALQDSHEDEDYPDLDFQEPYARPEPKVGRNDPCPCGSGKKYKKCCLKTEQTQPEDDFLWRRIRRAIEGSPAQLLSFGSNHFGQEALLEAWDEFMPLLDDEHDEPFTPDTPHMPIFMPWFFYDWVPVPHDSSVKREALDGRTLARAYLDKKGRHLDPLRVRYMEQCCIAPFSFYDVLSVRPGTGFTLRDIFTGEDTEVTEHSGSQQTQVGDIMFAKLARIDQVTMLEACAPVMFPPTEKSAILDLRKKINRRKLPLTPELLKEYIYEMLSIYHDITARLLNPPIPQLQNTDGDPLLLHKLIYDLACSPRETLDSLKPLNLTEDAESILTGAEFDPAGELRKIEFAWEKPGNKRHTNWNNTILGHLRIEGATLTAEVNSENRAQKFKKLMEELLAGKARYKTTVIESPQAMLARSKKEGDTTRAKQIQKEHDELNSQPEVQAQIDEYLRQHYRDWINQKIPLLKNKTPLQAVKTQDGKEMVEALLMEFERRGMNDAQPIPPDILIELRKKLGLS